MLPIQIGRHNGQELRDHCRRVMMLTLKTAECLPLGIDVKAGMANAACRHHSENLLEDPPAGDVAGEILNRLLLPAPANADNCGLAARIVEICDAFDEAMEFAAFDGESLSAAMKSFFAERSGEFLPQVVASLRRTACGTDFKWSSSDLPVIPKMATVLMRMPEDSTSPAQLAQIVAGDPVLSGKLIGLANSARFGSRNPIRRLNQAALRVGVPIARKALLSACMGGLFASKELKDLWHHSQQVAAAAYALAGRCAVDCDSAWLAGLLHDIGRLIFLKSKRESIINLRQWMESGFPLVYAESLTFGTDHAALGALILRNWGIPEEIAAAVEFHHRPESTSDALASVVFLAGQCDEAGRAEGLLSGFRRMSACRNVGIEVSTLAELDPAAQLLELAG